LHISEGVLSGPVLLSGMALAAAGTGIGIKKLDFDHLAEAGILSAAFFVASLIHVPIGPSSVHLLLNGIIGLLLGWAAFPSIMVALFLQAIFFQFGGLTTLGVNTVVMALPGVVCYYLFAPLLWKKKPVAVGAAFACGFLAVLGSALLLGGALYFSEKNFLEVATLAVMAHLPVMIIEGIITAFCLEFLKKVNPEILPARAGRPPVTGN